MSNAATQIKDKTIKEVKQELTKLINMVRNKEMAFTPKTVDKYYDKYMNITHNKAN